MRDYHHNSAAIGFSHRSHKGGLCVDPIGGRAAVWGTAAWRKGEAYCSLFEAFSKHLSRTFDPVRPQTEAMHGLAGLRQGDRPLVDYIIEFRTLAAESKWNDVALQDQFYLGLSDRLKDALSYQPEPKSLDDLIDVAIRSEQRYREHQVGRSPAHSSSCRRPFVIPSPDRLDNPEPM